MTLATLDPAAIGHGVTAAILDHVHTLAYGAGARVTADGASIVGASAALLCDWAQRGTNGEQWDGGMAWDAVQHVCTALYSCAGEPGTYGSGPLDDGQRTREPETDIEVVLLAAWCRVLIAQRCDVPLRPLAALAGLRLQTVRNLSADGEVAIARGMCAPDEARRWLSGRGVVGL